MVKNRAPRNRYTHASLSEADLKSAAFRYLSRFASTEANLMQVLMRKIKRALGPDAEPEDLVRGEELARKVAAAAVRAGLVNDRLYAEARARRLQNEGKSTQRIVQDLGWKGVGEQEIDGAIEGLREDYEGQNIDLIAAANLARRRKLGPYQIRGCKDDPDLRRRALGVFARAGFSLSIARRILDAEAPEDIELMLQEDY